MYQSHGPAAHRSNRDHHYYVVTLLSKVAHYPSHALPQKPLRPEGVAHVGVVGGRRRADLAQCCKFVESRDRQYRVQVLLSVGRVDVKVAHANVAGPYRPRPHAIRRVGKPGILPLVSGSKGRSVFKASAAELTSDTAHFESGAARGVHGICVPPGKLAQRFIARFEIASRKRQESTVLATVIIVLR